MPTQFQNIYAEIVRETSKAYQIDVFTADGKKRMWIAKKLVWEMHPLGIREWRITVPEWVVEKNLAGQKLVMPGRQPEKADSEWYKEFHFQVKDFFYPVLKFEPKMATPEEFVERRNALESSYSKSVPPEKMEAARFKNNYEYEMFKFQNELEEFLEKLERQGKTDHDLGLGERWANQSFDRFRKIYKSIKDLKEKIDNAGSSS